MTNEKKINCIIVDDEFLARKLISDYVNKIPSLNLIGCFDSALGITHVLQENEVHLIFSDIEMDDILGIDFFENLLLPNPPLIIFITAYSEYAVKAFEVNAVGYLVKPVTFPRFLKTVNKALYILNSKLKLNEFVNEQKNKSEKENFIIIKIDRKYVKLFFEDIQYIEGALEYVIFHTKDGKYMSLFSLKKLEELLPKENFMRIHKSYIVALNKITMLDGNQVYINNQKIAVSKTHKNELIKRIK